MALISNLAKSPSRIKPLSLPIFNRSSVAYASNSTDNSTTNKGDKANKSDSDSDGKSGGWLGTLFSSSRIHTGNEPHSRLLAASEYIYEMQHHDAKPACSEDYIKKYESYSKEVSERTNNKAELVASFRVEIGNQDQFVHIWRYHDGYKKTSEIQKILRTDETLAKMNRDQAQDLRKRNNQFMMAFSFWGHPMPQVHDSFYEMRSYLLKPGTMIEWANGWSRGITHRDNQVAGFFSQIGQMYTVHHIWRYQDLQLRKDVRENAWRKPGWDECVAITVPNIINLHSRWMSPNSFSPIR